MNFMKKTVLLLSVIGIACKGFAQYAAPPSSADIIQMLKKVNTIGSVLYVAAHPDDENTRLLAYMAREKNLRTGYVSLTRGDGGQNLIGKEQGEPLGVIRTQELLAARRTDGAEQFFTRANDFGYSKNPEETFQIWNKDSILSDLVLVIRKFKPDLIICRFPVTGEGGHGHHTASAILAVEAFDAAADKNRFSEQLARYDTWQAKRIFFNAFSPGNNKTTSKDTIRLDVGIFNPVLGKGYGEIAAESRSNHKSQGFGAARVRGSIIENFIQLKGDTVFNDLFERMDQTWTRIRGSSEIKSMAMQCLQRFDPSHPEGSVPDLVKLYSMIKELKETDPFVAYWKTIKLKETEALLLACSGLWLETFASEFTSIPGNEVNLTVQVAERNEGQVMLNKISFFSQSDTMLSLTLKTNQLYSFTHTERLPSGIAYTSPYWLTEAHPAGMYEVKNRQLISKPENDPPVMIGYDITISGLDLHIEKPVVFKYTDPVKGEIYRPFEVLPPATVNMAEKVLVFGDMQPRPVQFIIRSNAAGVKGKLEVKVPDGWSLKLNDAAFDLAARGDEIALEGLLTPGSSNAGGKMTASLVINGKSYTKSIQRIEYDHIPYQFILSEAEIKVEKINLKKSKANIGYIAGAGDEIPSCLKQLGYQVTTLTDDMLTNDDLSVYNAIVTGVRAYNTNSRLQVHYNRLMDYIKNGGNLVVQYNTNNRIGPVQAKIGPWPLTISRDRVTDEHAEVSMLKPEHSAFVFPNKIEQRDFEGWIQERGIYFASEMDAHYETLLAMHDPGEKNMNGSLVVAPYGKGNFVYTGLVFFRQLPAGVPGAYRLFVNLLSLPQHPE